MPQGPQAALPLGELRNSELFSNHWLEHRLPLEPEWTEVRADAERALKRIHKIWKEQKSLVEHYDSEASLEHAFIQPIFGALDWKVVYQTLLRGRKPDYALFLDDAAHKAAVTGGRDSIEYWNQPKLLADAKAWHISLDRPSIVNERREFPPEQIEWYLDKSRLNYGILTNGRFWRLIPRELTHDQPRFETYLEVDLPSLIEAATSSANLFQRERAFDDFLRFYLFFGPNAYREIEGRVPLITRAMKGSSEYRLGIGEDLKERVFEALRLCIEGFLKHKPNDLDPARDLAVARAQSFILLYRLLFILYAEDRGLLPYRKNQAYTVNRSLGRTRDEIAGPLDRANGPARDESFDMKSTAMWDDLKLLFDIVNTGKKSYGVPAYNGGMFDEDGHPFLNQKALPDFYLARVIDHLSRALDEDHPDSGLFRVDYRDLRIQHLGNIYEGLLELHPHVAMEPMREIREQSTAKRKGGGRSEKIVPTREPIPEGYETPGKVYSPGEIYLLTDKGERRATGSYYTPNHIVDHLVERTIGPLCEKIGTALEIEIKTAESALRSAAKAEHAEIKTLIARLKAEFDDRILQLKVLDPAMGSGHFLIRACQYLAGQIAIHPFTGDPEADQLTGEESALTFWKRRVAERCLYGVDMNPMAVELAKLALWLETVSVEQPLTFLDHHLRHGNSLVGALTAELGHLPGSQMQLQDAFNKEVAQKLPEVLQPLAEIRKTASDTPQQVKSKEKLLKQTFERLRPFTNLADLWTATYYLDSASQPNPAQYEKVMVTLGTPVKHAKITEEVWFKSALVRAEQPDAAFFHWELEFPEVFFTETGRREGAGFDALIGNPPYDVLAEKETGHDLTAFKHFIAEQARFAPSVRGKNNLYKLFICQALDLLAEGGRLGFIVPMAVLGDDQAADIRRAIFKNGAFESIEAFPQKDNPDLRVFREAKLSSAAFTLVKTADAKLKEALCKSRVHPAQYIEANSPALELSTATIPLYDPENLTVVSCSQADWDLAVKITGNKRMRRLKEFVEFFQGEINETVERAKGNILGSGMKGGQLVVRGASVCLYVPRVASQGNDIRLNKPKYLEGRGADSKAFHHRYRRVGLQESCPQNNFRRLIAALISAGEFCNHKINYAPEHTAKIPLEFVLALLNSKLSDWFFRLGSTNAAVSHYQLYNLPCPYFADELSPADTKTLAAVQKDLNKGDYAAAFDRVEYAMKAPPFGAIIRELIVELVNRIIAVERDRGAIKRAERSRLADAAQPLQDLLDRLFYEMAGLNAEEAAGLEIRLERML